MPSSSARFRRISGPSLSELAQEIREPSHMRRRSILALLALAVTITITACERQPATDRHSENATEKANPRGLIPATEGDATVLRQLAAGNDTVVRFSFGGLDWAVPRKYISAIRRPSPGMLGDHLAMRFAYSSGELGDAGAAGAHVLVHLQSYPNDFDPLVPFTFESVGEELVPIQGLEPLGLLVSKRSGKANGVGIIGRKSSFGDDLGVGCGLLVPAGAARSEINIAIARAAQQHARCDGRVQLNDRLYMRFWFPAEYALEYERIYDALAAKLAQFTVRN